MFLGPAKQGWSFGVDTSRAAWGFSIKVLSLEGKNFFCPRLHPKKPKGDRAGLELAAFLPFSL
jgi:hypothetical protein